MAPPSRMAIGDEEWGKKDDDLKLRGKLEGIPPGPDIRGLFRPRRKRLIQLLCILFLLYIFVKNIPERQIPLASTSRGRSPPIQGSKKQPVPSSSSSSGGEELPPKDDEDKEIALKHYFNGPIKFYNLAATLQGAAKTYGHLPVNKNIMFAVGSLKSASNLLPIACEMARWRRNHVHFSFLGRDDISLEDLMALNGLGSDCEIFWHDARPDFATHSSDFRMEVGVLAALRHIENFIHPQAYIVDNAANEERFFFKGLEARVGDLQKPVIELPSNALESVLWLTRLDSGSLSAWNNAQVEILIQATSGSSGSLLRLLRSLQMTDFFSTVPPRLTIELPNHVDRPLQDYLRWMKWPPLRARSSTSSKNMLTLRHRIPSHGNNAMESSVRMLESFYPATPHEQHLLLLSPNVELSPLWYHYLKYALLEYKYSSYGAEDTQNLLGISLEIPSTYINRTTGFEPPKVAEDETGGPSTFLWQAPNVNAALYFGDKWKEFHSFLTHRLAAKESVTRVNRFTRADPAWLEYLLEVMLARGYSMLYPAFHSDESIVKVHNELFHAPEEWSNEPSATSIDPEEATSFKADPAKYKSAQEPSLAVSTTLLSLLTGEGDLPEVPTIPLLGSSGQLITSAQLKEMTEEYSKEFREEVGGCSSAVEPHLRQEDEAGDLFCNVGEEVDEEVSVEEKSWNKAHVTTAIDGALRPTPTATDANSSSLDLSDLLPAETKAA